jgi:ribonuclease Z
MFVAFLGTGNALPSIDRANTALALVAAPGDPAILIDCGGDPYRALLRAGITAGRISDLIITHAHIDHIGGLPSLVESFRIAGRTTPLHIYAIPHAMQVVRNLFATFAFELTLDRWPFAVELYELTPGETITVGNFTITPIATEHSIPSVGLRAVSTADPQGPVFAYTSDTMIAPVLQEIARDATFLIAEATYMRGHEEAARVVRHMTAHQAAEVAAKGNAQSLALVHLSVSHDDERHVQREARQHFRGDVFIPHDNTVYQVERRRVRLIGRLP